MFVVIVGLEAGLLGLVVVLMFGLRCSFAFWYKGEILYVFILVLDDMG